jgi:5-formyltetrahydrofolate cyclo-ligase
MQNKSQLRQHYQTIRNQLSDAERTHQQQTVLESLKNFKPYTQAKTLAVYLPFKGEFDTDNIIKHALASGKDCYAPIITDHDNGQMIFKALKLSGDCIEFLENDSNPDHPINFDCMLIPLVAFDKNNHRLGMGGGFYDRYLALYTDKKPCLLGLAYKEQLCDELPHDPWDQDLDAVMTADGFLN